MRVAKEFAWKSVAITLVVLSHGMCNRMFRDRFQCLGKTISQHMKMVVTLLGNVMS